jgi:polyphosphate kinase
MCKYDSERPRVAGASINPSASQPCHLAVIMSRHAESMNIQSGNDGSAPRLLNHELGILKFNERVLAMAADPRVPALERLRYITIVSSNLDEFFEIRVAEQQQLARLGRDDPGSHVAALETIAAVARTLVAEQYRLLNEAVLPQLAGEGVVILLSQHWNEAQRHWAERVFDDEIEPLLTPIALDPAHPFPRILNKSLNFVVGLEGEDRFGRQAGVAIVQAPRALPRVLSVPAEVAGVAHGVMLLSSIMLGFMHRLFPGLAVREVHQFRLTRNSDLFVDDEEVTDLREALQGELQSRNFGDEVRLEVSAGAPPHLVERLLLEFDLLPRDCYAVNGPVNLVRLQQVIDLVDRADLKFESFEAAVPAELQGPDLFAAIRRRDILLHHPYQSFAPVMRFLLAAARDPAVVAIKQTVYRTGADSALMQALIEAARAGKEVTVVVELMARFDEQTNINWAAKLAEAGAHVVYGVVGHKTHAKMAMVLRREPDGPSVDSAGATDDTGRGRITGSQPLTGATGGGRLRRYVHLGTGNYHPRTARLYEDFGLFTADPEVCADVHEVFHRLTGLGERGSLRVLAQSPFTLLDRVLDSVRRETALARAGRPAWIAAKINALSSEAVIEALYEASQAGVRIDLIVRGICALRPGVPGLSDNIRVRSIIGRFLEHSRVYVFGNEGDPQVWLSSADWMDRNLLRRVEVAFPVRRADLRRRVIREAITAHMNRHEGAWVMDADGDYQRLGGGKRAAGRHSQERLLERLVGGAALRRLSG